MYASLKFKIIVSFCCNMNKDDNKGTNYHFRLVIIVCFTWRRTHFSHDITQKEQQKTQFIKDTNIKCSVQRKTCPIARFYWILLVNSVHYLPVGQVKLKLLGNSIITEELQSTLLIRNFLGGQFKMTLGLVYATLYMWLQLAQMTSHKTDFLCSLK